MCIRDRSKMSNKSAMSQSELSRRNEHQKIHKHKLLQLDKDNLTKLQKPEYWNDKSLYVPEGYSSDHKKELRHFARATLGKDSPLKNHDPMRSVSAQKLM